MSRETLKKYGNGEYEHMFELDARYPEVAMFGPQCISAEVRRGWAPLLEDCLKVLSQHGCKVNQIKQKFCGLRIYWQYPDHIESALEEWRKIPSEQRVSLHSSGAVLLIEPPYLKERDAIDAVIKPMLEKAEILSFQICDLCGIRMDRPAVPSAGSPACGTCSKRR